MHKSKTKSAKSDGTLRGVEWCVGDLAQSIKYPDLIYMIIPRDFARATTSLPMQSDQKSLAGVVVHTGNGFDSDGDPLPQIGSVHPGFGAEYFQHYKGRVTLW